MSGDQGHETWIETETVRDVGAPLALIVLVALVWISAVVLLAAELIR